jgi:hypothetical protein
MSEEKCEGVGSAQDAHKHVKVPRGDIPKLANIYI